jgi:signal transduction histidine kinase/GAF domain-containing protein
MGRLPGPDPVPAPLVPLRKRARNQAETAIRRYQMLQAVSDAALAHLSSQDLIDELLVRVTAVLDVDNTAILTVAADDDRQLIVHVARGPEQALSGQVRVPIGQGFAGRIADSRQPMIVTDVRELAVANPFLKQTVRSLMGVPLVVHDRLIGVLHIGTRAARHFSDDDLQLLQLVGSRIAMALDHARLYEEEHRLRAESAARAGELEAVFEAITDGVFVFDHEGRVVRYNGAARDLLNIKEPTIFYAQPASVRGDGAEILDANGEPLPFARQPLSRILRGEVLTGASAVDMKVRTNGDDLVQINVSGAPIRDQSQNITGAVCVLRDVTERRRLEARVLAERNRLQQVLNVLPEGVLLVDAHPPAVVATNHAADEFLGFNMVGQPVPIPPPGEHGELGARRLDGTPFPLEELPVERALLRGEVVRGEQFLIRNATNGREIAILSNSAPLSDADGVVDGAVAVFQDITAIKEMERQREEFLTTVSHDLKNPLTTLMGTGQLLQRRTAHIPEPQRTRFDNGLRTIQWTARQMGIQINELLDVTRARMGKPLQLELVPTDIALLVTSAVEEYQRATDRHTLRFQQEGEAVQATVDAPRLERALGNLLANALKYSPRGGEILTTVTYPEDPEGAWITIAIADQGVGIPQEEITRVLEGGYRASNVAGQYAGNGFGLASVQLIVAQHNGRFELQSGNGSGTTATIRLPLRQPPDAKAT